MKVLKVAVILSALYLAGSTALMAQTIAKAVLTGGEETPGVATNASGTAIFWVYSDHLEYVLTAKGFGTNVLASHIHLGPKGVSGPICVPIFNAATQGTFTGRLTGVLTEADLVPLADRGVSNFRDVIDAILGGRAYVNIHTTLSPSGEIRGQLTVADDSAR